MYLIHVQIVGYGLWIVNAMIWIMALKFRQRILAPLPPELRTGFEGFRYRLLNLGLEAFGLYYGVYRGRVIAPGQTTERELGGGYGWIRVSIPSIGDPPDSGRIAWPSVPVAGENHGFHSLPQEGDLVLVIFEGGRLDAPIWIGSWWSSGNIDDDHNSTDRHWWVTPGGHRVMLDDTSGSEVVEIEHSSGAKIEIDAQGAINVTAASGQKITLSSGGVTEAAGKGDKIKDILSSLCDGLVALTVGTPAGPSTVPTNSATFIAIKARLETIKSQIVDIG